MELIVVALVSGLIGTLVSTQLRISHERASELRTRMLEAADDFVRAVDETSRLLSRAEMDQTGASLFAHQSTTATQYRERADASREAANTGVSDVTARVPRIRLLFGPDDPATRHAERASETVNEAMIAIYRFLSHYDDDQALEDDADLDEAREAREYTDDERDRLVNTLHHHSEATVQALDDFSRQARRAISGRSWRDYIPRESPPPTP